ncbi:unnamed protein product [Malus baccata var. baccata]
MVEIVDNDDVTSWMNTQLHVVPHHQQWQFKKMMAFWVMNNQVKFFKIMPRLVRLSFEFTNDYHGNTHFDNVKSNDAYTKVNVGEQKCTLTIRKNYEFKVERSTKDHLEIRCVDDNCKWRLCATKLQVSEYFESKYEGASCIYRPKDIIEDMRAQVGVNMSYKKAWRAREHESFATLPAYCAMLESKNHGTVTHIETDDNNHFLYFFIVMGASIRGFQGSMRHVVAVDGTFLKGKYLGTLFFVVCHDGQNQIYPLVFSVGDSENDTSWTWFLTKLRSAIRDLVFVSDRQGSIGKAVKTVFPEAYHGACMYHVAGNMRNKFGDDETMFKLYYIVSKTYLVSEFNSVMNDIWAIKDGKVGKYLQEIGYHRWARAHFNAK